MDLKAAEIAELAAATTVVTFLRDWWVRRKESRSEQKREPAEISSIILSNARSAMELQSGVFETLKRELEARDAVIREQAQAGALKDVELTRAAERANLLLARIGELTNENEALRRRLPPEGTTQ